MEVADLEIDVTTGASAIVNAHAAIEAVVLQPVMYFPTTEHMETLLLGAQKFGRDKLRFTRPEKRTLIDTARNRLLHRAMAGYPTAKRFIFIDSDTAGPVGDVEWWRYTFKTTLPERYGAINLFEHLMSIPLDRGIVGGAYFDRIVGHEIQCSRGCGSAKEPGFNEKYSRGGFRGLLECSWVGTGCAMIPRWVVQKLIDNVDRWPECAPSSPGKHYGFFTRPKHLQGEDVALGLRAGELGIKSWLSCDLRLFHEGKIWR